VLTGVTVAHTEQTAYFLFSVEALQAPPVIVRRSPSKVHPVLLSTQSKLVPCRFRLPFPHRRYLRPQLTPFEPNICTDFNYFFAFLTRGGDWEFTSSLARLPQSRVRVAAFCPPDFSVRQQGFVSGMMLIVTACHASQLINTTEIHRVGETRRLSFGNSL